MAGLVIDIYLISTEYARYICGSVDPAGQFRTNDKRPQLQPYGPQSSFTNRKPPTTWFIWVITFLNCYHAVRFFSLNSRFFKSFINVTYAHLATFFSNRCESLQLKNTMSCREVQGHEVAFHDHVYRMTGHLPATRKKHSKTYENWRSQGNLQREQN